MGNVASFNTLLGQSKSARLGVPCCCQGGEGKGGGCSLDDGKAFFTAMYVELAKPRTHFEVEGALQYWLAKLGVEKSVSNR